MNDRERLQMLMDLANMLDDKYATEPGEREHLQELEKRGLVCLVWRVTYAGIRFLREAEKGVKRD